jgi:hypothetical protein
MNPRDALRVLIEQSDLDLEQKEQLLAHLPEMTDESVMELGTELAKYRVQQIAAARRAVAAIDDLLSA